MRFYTSTHKHYCGIDLHARTMYVCVLNEAGEIRLHKNIKTSPEALLEAIEPFRDDHVVAVECIFTWYWIADFCTEQGIRFVLGHALYMRAIHGGKAKNDRIDAHKVAVLLRGGMLPQAYVYPREMRATRDLLRRRLHFVRKRGELLAHIQNTHSQYNRPAPEGNPKYKKNRPGLADRFEDPSVKKSVDVDLAMVEFYDPLLRDLEATILRTAREHDPETLHRLQSVPGIGKILALTILYEIHDIARFPRVQDFASCARLVACTGESAGKKHGTSGRKIGNAHLKWAFSEATLLYLRGNPEGQKLLRRLERKHGKGKALSILAHKLGRSVYHMLQTRRSFDREKFLNAWGGEQVSPSSNSNRKGRVPQDPSRKRPVRPRTRARGHGSHARQPPALIGRPFSLRHALPPPEPEANWASSLLPREDGTRVRMSF